MFEGTLCIHPVWTVFPQRVGDVMAQSSSFLARGGSVFRFDVLAGSPEDSRSSNRKSGFSFANGLYPLSLCLESQPRKQCPLRGRHGRQRGKLQSTTSPPARRQTAPSRSKVQSAAKLQWHGKKSKCALTDGRLFPAPSTARFPYPVPPPSHEVTAGSAPPPPPSPHQLIRMHEAHGLGNQQGPCPSRFLETRLASSKTTKRKPPRGVRPSSTGPGAWAECRPQPTT